SSASRFCGPDGGQVSGTRGIVLGRPPESGGGRAARYPLEAPAGMRPIAHGVERTHSTARPMARSEPQTSASLQIEWAARQVHFAAWLSPPGALVAGSKSGRDRQCRRFSVSAERGVDGILARCGEDGEVKIDLRAVAALGNEHSRGQPRK